MALGLAGEELDVETLPSGTQTGVEAFAALAGKRVGTPAGPDLRAGLLDIPESPELVAEFAATVALIRRGSRWVERPRGANGQWLDWPRRRERSNWLWIVYGNLARARTGALVIESFGVGPAFEHQIDDPKAEKAVGVTSELLRAFSPARLIADTVAALGRQEWLLDLAHAKEPAPGRPLREMSERQRNAFVRIAKSRRTRTRLSEQDLVQLSTRYLTLCRRGVRNPVKQISLEMGTSQAAARDRVARARELGYLTKGEQGRAGAGPGPKLRALGFDAQLRRAHNPCDAKFTLGGYEFICGRELGHRGRHIDRGDGISGFQTVDPHP